MNSRDFASKWIEQSGLSLPDSDYGGMVGEAVKELWNCFADQGHSGSSAAATFAAFSALFRAYDDPDSAIWQEYWKSAEGKALKAGFLQESE